MNTEIFSSQWKPYELLREMPMLRAVGQMKTSMGETRVPSPTITFVSQRRHARGRRRVWTPLPQYLGLSQMANPYSIPPTSKLSATSHNESYPDGSSTSPISLTSSTHPSPIGASTPGGSSHCPGDTGQHGWHHHTNTCSYSKPSASGSSPGDSGRWTT